MKTLFGVECVKEKQQIDLVIKLEDWKKENEYDRLGLEDEYAEFLFFLLLSANLQRKFHQNVPFAGTLEVTGLCHLQLLRQKQAWFSLASMLKW